MSTMTQLICNNFGGIRHKNAVFTNELISAQDIQNVELYSTGSNNGVGIRTAQGNVSIAPRVVEKVFNREAFTVVGSLTITDDGIASGFTQTNFLSLPNKLNLKNNKWVIKAKVTTGENVDTHNDFFGSSDGTDKKHIGIGQQNKRFKIYLSSNGTSWDIAIAIGSIDIQPNTTYYVKLEYTGTEYILSQSKDGITWNIDKKIVNSNPVYDYPNVQAIGVNKTSKNYAFVWNGSIDLKQFSISVDGKEVFSGLKEVVTSGLPEGERIINIFESIQNGTTFFFVHTVSKTEGKFYLFENGVYTLIKGGLSITETSTGFDIIQGWKDLFFFTNGKEMFSYEIETSSVVDMNNLQDKDGRKVLGLGACLFAGRLWIFHKNILWYSLEGNIYDFKTSDADWKTSAGYVEYLKDITAIHEYIDSLAVFSKDSSVQLTVKNGILANTDESPGGCAGVHALIFHDTNLYFYDDTKKAVFSFKQVITGEKALGDNIAIEIQDLLLKIDKSKLNQIHTQSVVLKGRNEIWWILPTEDEKYSEILIFDYLRGEWLKRKSQKINSVRVIHNELFSAGNDGNLLKEYVGNTFNGEFIPHYYNFSPMNLGAMNTLKVLVFQPRVSLDLPATNEFWVKYVKNFNVFKKPKIKLIKGKFKNFLYWGLGRWGEKYWASDSTNSVGKFPNATFKILEISVYTETSNQSFAFKNIEFSKIKVKQV